MKLLYIYSEIKQLGNYLKLLLYIFLILYNKINYMYINLLICIFYFILFSIITLFQFLMVLI